MQNERRKQDRRVVRTRAAIRTAFLSLARAQQPDKISVTALARTADIDRKTFYLHYDSIDSLIDELLYEESQRIADILREGSIDGDGHIDVNKMYSLLSTELASGLDERALILGHMDMSQVLRRIEPIMVSVIIENDSLHLGHSLGKHLEYFVSFFCAGLLSVYRHWMETDSEIPMDELADMVSVLVLSGLEGALTKEKTARKDLSSQAEIQQASASTR